MRRNLNMTHRYLGPRRWATPEQIAARQKAHMAETIGLAMGDDPTLSMDADEARRVAVRFQFDLMIKTGRMNWVGGVPTRADLAAIERRLGGLLGLTPDEVTDALRGHPRPQTIG